MQKKTLVRIVLFSSALLLIALNTALARLSSPQPPDLSTEQGAALRRAFGQCNSQAGDDREKLPICMDGKIDGKVGDILTPEQQNHSEPTQPPVSVRATVRATD